MNIINLDVVAWRIICKHVHPRDYVAIANTHPRMRRSIRMLASVLMSELDIYYIDDPFRRLMQLCQHVQYTMAFDIAQIDTSTHPLVNCVQTTHPYEGDYMSGSCHKIAWVSMGAPPPRGINAYILLKTEPFELYETRASMYFTVDRAVQECVQTYYEDLLHDLWNACELRDIHTDIDPHNEVFCSWLRSRNIPLPAPFTRDHMHSFMVTHRRIGVTMSCVRILETTI